MARLKHATSGVVVNVDEAFAARLGSDWEPVDDAKKEEAKPAKRAAAKKSDEK